MLSRGENKKLSLGVPPIKTYEKLAKCGVETLVFFHTVVLTINGG